VEHKPRKRRCRHAGGESLENKRRKEDKHKQDGFEGNGKGEDVEKGKRVRGTKMGQNFIYAVCTCLFHPPEHTLCKQCNGLGICEHNRRR
jgi:hypothetical protein